MYHILNWPAHMQPTPPAEILMDEPLADQLLREQHPDLAGQPIELLDSGWDNYMFRLGNNYLLRFPRREVSIPLLENEQRWLPLHQARLPIRISAPIRIGRPSPSFNWPWSVLPYFEGVSADREEPLGAESARLGSFLRALHEPAPEEAPYNRHRSVPLQDREPVMRDRIAWLQSRTDLVNHQLRDIWRDAVNAPRPQEAVWLHGDLHARNMIIDQGRISGIIDWGDLARGDGATDLAIAWAIFARSEDREQLWAAYDSQDPHIRRRAKGWAILFGVALLWTGLVDHPQHALMGRRTLERVLTDQ